MTRPQPQVADVLTFDRLTAARDSLTRYRRELDPALCLTDSERLTLRQALRSCRHPLATYMRRTVARIPQGGSMMWASTLLLVNKLLHDPQLDYYNTATTDTGEALRCSACPATTPLIPGGLCVGCYDRYRFVTRPPGHFEAMLATLAADDALRQHEWQQRGAVYIGTVDADEQTWSCGYCWYPLPVDDDEEIIPLVGDDGLCDDCVRSFPGFPDAWTRHGPHPCGCPVCQVPLPRREFAARTGLVTDPYRYAYVGIDR